MFTALKKFLADNYKALMLTALMFAVVFVFYPVLDAGFVNLDDKIMVEDNWKIRSFSADNIKAMLFEPHYLMYHPLVNLSFAVEYALFKTDPYFYHADNLILHLINILLVFFILRRLTKGNFAVSFITAFIFACHPMHVEPVAWVSARKDLLYSLFFLSSVLFYLKADDDKKYKTKNHILSLALFLCACLSKSMAVTLPAVLILLDWFEGKKFEKRRIYTYIPFILTAVIFAAATYFIYYDAAAAAQVSPYRMFGNFISAHFNVMFYIAGFFAPVT